MTRLRALVRRLWARLRPGRPEPRVQSLLTPIARHRFAADFRRGLVRNLTEDDLRNTQGPRRSSWIQRSPGWNRKRGDDR